MPESPALSIIIATYNRSQVLKHAIRSVLESTYTDWELIVVGDACTDDTAECVESFRDSRIRFVNLPVNCGDQSGPNNHGIGLARGRYVAFLNHDDLYLPDHLATCIAELDASGAELVWAPAASTVPRPGDGPSGLPFSFTLYGMASAHGYTPLGFYSASSWVFRRELAERIGPWAPPSRLFVTTSQEWLFRAWRAGTVMRFVPRLGVLLVGSGTKGGYARRFSALHEQVVSWMKEDGRCRERLIEDAAMNSVMALVTSQYAAPWWRHFARGVLYFLYALLRRAGVHPLSLTFALRHGGRGGFMRWHRKFTGVDRSGLANDSSGTRPREAGGLAQDAGGDHGTVRDLGT